MSAAPGHGVEGQFGGLALARGESTEITTYDEDGYVTGERLSLRRPADLFFDEISLTNAYLTAAPDTVGVSSRWRYLDDVNYRQVLLDKKLGKRGGVSTDFTSAAGVSTWREAINVKTPELRVVDSIVFENYQRTNAHRDYGFALSLERAVSRRLGFVGGYASIDPNYGGLNADRFHIGNRLFLTTTCTLSPRFAVSYFITRAVGNSVALPQRTLMNVIFSYNLLRDLRRTIF